MIALNFVICLPKTLGKFDSIWVVVDKLTKLANFILVSVDYNAEQLDRIYVNEIVRMLYPFPSSHNVVPFSLPIFGGSCMMNWNYNSLLVQPSIPRRMDNQKVL